MAEPAELRKRASSANTPRRPQRLAGGLLVLAWIVLLVGVCLPGVEFFGPTPAWFYLALPVILLLELSDAGEDLRLVLLIVPPMLSAMLCMVSTLALLSKSARKHFLPRLKLFAWTLLLIWLPVISAIAKEGRIPHGIYFGVFVVCSGFTLAFIAIWIWNVPKHEREKKNRPDPLTQGKQETDVTRVFVYGTLKTGFENHRRYCSGIVSAVPAQTRGLLYLLENKGYPIAFLPARLIVAQATGDFAVDRAREHTILSKGPLVAADSNGTQSDPLNGELLTFDDARERLPLLDSLETFRPDGSGEYMRCLIWTEPPNSQLAWIYVAPPGWVPDETCRLIDRFPAE